MKSYTSLKLEISVHQNTGRKYHRYTKLRTWIEKIFLKSETKRQNSIIFKWAEDVNQHFATENTQTKHMNTVPTFKQKSQGDSTAVPQKGLKVSKCSWLHGAAGTLAHCAERWCWERLRAGGEGGDRGWDGWMASLTWWTWVWVDSGIWWWTGRPGVCSSWSCKESDTTEQLNWLTDLFV